MDLTKLIAKNMPKFREYMSNPGNNLQSFFLCLAVVVMRMAIFVGMLQSDGIEHHQDCGCDHDGKTDIELHDGLFVRQHHTKDASPRNGAAE